MVTKPNTQSHLGFTLIELLVVLTLLAILAAIVTPQYLDRVQDAKELTLQHNLHETRKVIDQFYRDKQRYPKTLNELVEQRYIRALPIDPITHQNGTWTIVKSDSGDGVMDLRSAAPGTARNGSHYATW